MKTLDKSNENCRSVALSLCRSVARRGERTNRLLRSLAAANSHDDQCSFVQGA